MYCGNQFMDKDLTRDHVIPQSRGGKDAWSNVVTACKRCNNRKADRLLQEIGMSLLAVPFVPNHAEWLVLRNRKILADQMSFLASRCSKAMRW
jgi:5-methylcytosine-specific restriction endonuclease McrA